MTDNDEGSYSVLIQWYWQRIIWINFMDLYCNELFAFESTVT